MSLDHLRKRARNAILLMAAELLILGGILLPQFGLSLVEYGSVYILLLLFLIVVLILSQSISPWHILRLQRQLKEGQPMAHRRDWHKGAIIHKAGGLVSWLLISLLICCQLHHSMKNIGLGEMALTEYLDAPPFVTLEELSPEAVLIDYIDYYNNRRIKARLKGLPPALHRQQALLAA